MGWPAMLEPLRRILDLGGPVVVVLIAVSVLALATILYKLWQFRAAAVGQHHALTQALSAWDGGDRAAAFAALDRSPSYLAPVVALGMGRDGPPAPQDRLAAEAEMRFASLERGLRLLDFVAQIAPLLGLFGTVLGMIEAFQAMQDAGAQVDPSILAGGIWVALLTTAVGLAVAMPTSLALTWFEGRMERERVFAAYALATAIAPAPHAAPARRAEPARPGLLAHGV